MEIFNYLFKCVCVCKRVRAEDKGWYQASFLDCFTSVFEPGLSWTWDLPLDCTSQPASREILQSLPPQSWHMKVFFCILFFGWVLEIWTHNFMCMGHKCHLLSHLPEQSLSLSQACLTSAAFLLHWISWVWEMQMWATTPSLRSEVLPFNILFPECSFTE